MCTSRTMHLALYARNYTERVSYTCPILILQPVAVPTLRHSRRRVVMKRSHTCMLHRNSHLVLVLSRNMSINTLRYASRLVSNCFRCGDPVVRPERLDSRTSCTLSSVEVAMTLPGAVSDPIDHINRLCEQHHVPLARDVAILLRTVRPMLIGNGL